MKYRFTRRVWLAAVLLLALAGVGVAYAVGGSTGTVVACAYATVPAQTISDNGSPIATVPAQTGTQCVTTTYTVPTVTVTTTAPTTTTTPTPTSAFRVGVIGNVAGWGTTMQQNVLNIGAKIIREDRGDFALSWAQSHGITDICLIMMDPTSAGANCPVVELDNEPYNTSTWDVNSWAQKALSVAKAVRAAHPNATILLPIGPPWNNGNILVNGVWTDTVLAINNAAPGIWQYIDGVSVHPYSQPYAPSIRYPILDKWRANLKAIGHNLPFWITEIGWPTGGTTWPPAQTEQQQADYLAQAISDYKARGDVKVLMVYDMQDYGPRDSDSEHYFGLLRIDGSEKPSWSVVNQAIIANP